jgi:hypothetical protein
VARRDAAATDGLRDLLPDALSRSRGARSLLDAVSESATSTHRVARIRVAPDRCQIDYLKGYRRRQPKTVMCGSGERSTATGSP